MKTSDHIFRLRICGMYGAGILWFSIALGSFIAPIPSFSASVGSTQIKGPAPSWRSIASLPPQEIDPVLRIGDDILRPSSNPQDILRHFEQKPAHTYTGRWMSKHVHTAKNADRGKMWLEKGQIQYGNYAPVSVTVATLNWAESPFANFNWQWFHHQLMSVQYLLAAAKQSRDSPPLETAKHIVRSWASNNYTRIFPSPQSWNDHSTAYRLRTLVCLFEQLRLERALDSDFCRLLLGMIDSHCRILADAAFFQRHTNHGFDQATILYWAADAFPEFVDSSHWLESSQQRVQEEIAFMFTPEGIHVENSPSYHIWLLAAVEDYLVLSGQNGRSDLASLISRGWEYAAYALLPNGKLPLVGDTELRDFSNARSEVPTSGFQSYMYSASRGMAGLKPAVADRVFPRSGYAVFRDKWHDPTHFDQTFYLYFKCSFLANYHRHDDDLSLVLYALGEEWVIDSGLYGYEEDQPIRRFVRSPEAHNTVIVNGAIAIRDVGKIPPPGSRITDYGIEPYTVFVTGESLMYKDYVVKRRLEYRKQSQIIVSDSVSGASTSPAKAPDYTVRFHFPMDKEIQVVGDNRVIISSRRGHVLSFEILPTPRSITVGSGNSKSRAVSWVSESITRVQPSQCVAFEFSGTRNSTCTLKFARDLHSGNSLGQNPAVKRSDPKAQP